MSRIILVVLASALTTAAHLMAQQSSTLDAAAKALGTASLQSLQFTATGQAFVLGQPPTASEPWPLRPIKSYRVSLDYGTNAMRLEQVLTMPTPQPRGGGAPLIYRWWPDSLLNSSIDLIANYMVGNLVISIIAGVVAFVGFLLLDVRYALALAAWVAFTDIIPGVGALLGAAGVGAVVAFQGGPQLAAALILLLVYQQVENYLIAPRVMNRAIDLNPATVIIALLVGGSLAGLVGALLALPIAAMAKIVVFELVVPGRIESLRVESAQSSRPPGRIRRRGARPLP